MTFIISLIFILHGFVHLLYFGQSRRYFELQPGMIWPDDSWLFARFLNQSSNRSLAGTACLLAAAGFLTGGIGLLYMQAWWHSLILGSAGLSILIFLLFWDGKWQTLADKGGIGLLINFVIIYVNIVYLSA
jgi:hypothetical protein